MLVWLNLLNAALDSSLILVMHSVSLILFAASTLTDGLATFDLHSKTLKSQEQSMTHNSEHTAVCSCLFIQSMCAGSGAAGGPNQLVMAPIIAVGTSTGQIYLVSISSGQVCHMYPDVCHVSSTAGLHFDM